MAQVVTFEGYRPPPRYDATAWTTARIDESTTAEGPWTTLETITLSPADADPENPAARDLTTELGTALGLWYRVVFLDATGDEAQPTSAVQNAASASAYATVSELARILKIRSPTSDQEIALERVLVSAAGEIDAEVGRDADAPLAGWEVALAAEVNLERAVEHWQQQEHAFGILGIGDGGPIYTARDSWNRHALKLAPLKQSWGIA